MVRVRLRLRDGVMVRGREGIMVRTNLPLCVPKALHCPKQLPAL